ncbi:hypothetical protein [Stenotrophomonas lactitubi]|uniref:hypothetical protein n=1 Tax=Stenotrophomonas lactitubi TaxID=2045214 RepID=UPI00289B380F|nr:hypothetical protein [Stenotrophomonas lactitubi]
MTPAELHFHYTEAIRTMPPFEDSERFTHLTKEQVSWQARTLAYLELQGKLIDVHSFKAAIARSAMPAGRVSAGLTFFQILTTAVTRAEIEMPPGARGVFVPVGDEFDALRSITELVQGAERDLFVVDPYADASFLLRFAHAARPGVQIRILRDAKYQEIGKHIQAAKDAWVNQYGGERPLEIRSAPSKTLHDRFIAQDSANVFLVSQSLKDLAVRSPATIQKADGELAVEKLEAYEAMWQDAKAM